jgi:cytochrome c oxidase assembly protein subunit 15
MTLMMSAHNGNIWLHRFAKLVASATFILIFIGGLVTSTESGLAVPDWPTTYGHFMFSFPLSQMVGGIVYEHGHRMVASVVGMLMVILAIWLWLKEPRRWVKQLGLVALLAVITQGILGGITVLLLLPTAVSVSHAALAQTFFCLTICLALFTSTEWQQSPAKVEDSHRPSLHVLTVATTAVVYVQLLLGAVMRHTKSGLAIPDFPLAFGGLLPPFDSAKIAIHFSHRVGALIVAILAIWTIARIMRYHRQEKKLYRPAFLLACALVMQLTLGALTIWTQKAVIPTTAHVATGALILGTSLVLALRAHRLLSVQERVRAEGGIGEAIPEAR